MLLKALKNAELYEERIDAKEDCFYDDIEIERLADENFEKLTGYTQEDIRENHIIQADLIPMEYRTEYLCQTSSNLAKNPLLFLDHPLLRKDGSTIQVFCFGRMYYDSAVRAQRAEIIITEN